MSRTSNPGRWAAALGSAVILASTLATVPAGAAPAPVAAPATSQASSPTGDVTPRQKNPDDPTVWVCFPDDTRDVCSGKLRTTNYLPDGGSEVTRPRNRVDAPVDCFYLYPTVSLQQTMNANLDLDPVIESITNFQAARFSNVCNVFAPVYRQITLAGLGGRATPAEREIAYRSALKGWRNYLKYYNEGRGFILIGHSQGAGMLRRIISETIDPKPRLRDRMITAVIAGSSVAVKKGTVSGGSFSNLPGCTSADQTQCVMSFATFGGTPPEDSLFGKPGVRPDGRPWNSERYEALCTNPARLDGSKGATRLVVPSEPLFGPFGVVEGLHGVVLPPTSTPWLSTDQRYRATCRTSNGVHVLVVRPTGSSVPLLEAPTPQWGTHLLDINLFFDGLLDITRQQVRSYLG